MSVEITTEEWASAFLQAHPFVRETDQALSVVMPSEGYIWKRGNIYWYQYLVGGVRYRRSTKQRSAKLALRVANLMRQTHGT